MELERVTLDQVSVYQELYGLPALRNPLVSVFDLKEATLPGFQHHMVHFECFLILLKQSLHYGDYGREPYDFSDGTVIIFSPGVDLPVDFEREILKPDAVGVVWHPDLMYGTPLGDLIHHLGFLSYSQMEALHLSEEERDIVRDCLAHINTEIERPIDGHSNDLISANICVLLQHINRFYDRQFITRHKANSEVVNRFNRELVDIVETGRLRDGIPPVSYFAEKANLSPGYFGDLIKKETGASVKEIISRRVVTYAKQRLAKTRDDISTIAYDLGFQYPQHFTRLFKRITGVSPTVYRAQTR